MNSYIDPAATIHPGVKLGRNVIIRGSVEIAPGTRIGDGCIIGGEPEHRWLEHSDQQLVIGPDCYLSDGVVIHHGVDRGTRIGRGCYLMQRSHVAHDGLLEEGVTLSGGVILGGHTTVMTGANLGILSATHQYVTIGSYCMLGMGAMLIDDLDPGFTAVGVPARIVGRNETGIVRAGNPDMMKEMARFESIRKAGNRKCPTR